MDLTMQMKSAELLLNFIKHDTEKIPLYGFMLQKQRFVPKPNTAPLPRSTPESEGVPSEAVESFFRDIEAQADSVACHAITVLRHGKVIAEGAYAPYRLDVPHMLYSMSKSITGLAVGMAIDEGYLDINERIIDIFPEYVTSSNAKALKSHTVWNLLTMSTGARFNEVGSGLDENWLKMYMQSTPKFEAGSAFDYNSLNSYVLAAAVVKRTGMSLTEFLTPRLYEPLGIRYHEWETCPKGIEKGGWGLSLTVEDAAKLGQLCLNRGRWNGEPIVSEKWIDAATSVQIQTPNGEMKHGYGYQIWMSDEEGAFQFNGAFGQYVLVFPKYDAVIAMYSGSASLFAHVGLSERVKQLLDTFKDEALQENGQAGASLKKCLDGLTYSPSYPDELGMDKEEFERIAYRLDGREYLAGPNTGGFFPQTLQVVHGNMTDSVSMFRFAKRGDDIILYIYEKDERNALVLKHDGSFELGAVTIRGERQLTGTRCRWKLEPRHIRLYVLSSFIETPNSRILSMDIYPHRMSVTFDELPALNRTAQMLFDLVGVSRMAFYRKLLPLLKSEAMVKLVKNMTEPVAECSIVKHNEDEPLPLLDTGKE